MFLFERLLYVVAVDVEGEGVDGFDFGNEARELLIIPCSDFIKILQQFRTKMYTFKCFLMCSKELNIFILLYRPCANSSRHIGNSA